MEYDLNEKRNEVLNLKRKLEVLEDVVQKVVSRVETITTPTKKGTKKRRRIKQTPTPSPSHKGEAELVQPVEEDHGQGAQHQADRDSDQSDCSLTAEDILKLYDSGQE